MTDKTKLDKSSRIVIIKAAAAYTKGGLNTFLFQSGRRWAGCHQNLKLLRVAVVPKKI